VDAMRARVQQQIEAQRRRSLQADVETQKLKLARLIGLAPGQAYDAADAYRFSSQSPYTEAEAIASALNQRNDLKAAQSGLHAAETAEHAAHAERYPNIAVDATF